MFLANFYSAAMASVDIYAFCPLICIESITPTANIAKRSLQCVLRPTYDLMYLRLARFASQDVTPTFSECVVRASLIPCVRRHPRPRHCLHGGHASSSAQTVERTCTLRVGALVLSSTIFEENSKLCIRIHLRTTLCSGICTSVYTDE